MELIGDVIATDMSSFFLSLFIRYLGFKVYRGTESVDLIVPSGFRELFFCEFSSILA